MNENFTFASQEFIQNQIRILMAMLAEIQKKLSEKINHDPKYYRNEDLKRIFKLSENTIDKYRKHGVLKYQMIGGIYYYPVDELNRTMKDNSNMGRI